ncbi:uroporphyrinogen-III synthase [Ezakiella coagulans]|uniref:uroporphyrinogen-III synthase n=1 Tax=Ezakiella coagulans TaxID=46507 RepID=UPI00288B950D|nr:uroporphyrinogen-III synthase [Ezakiella coagulans]
MQLENSSKRKFVVTRNREKSSKLASVLRKLGVEVFEIPTIEIVPINEAELKKYVEDFSFTHLVFHSQNAIKIFMDEFLKTHDMSELKSVKIYVVGKATKEAIEKYGLSCVAPKEKFTGDELVKIIKEDDFKERKIFLPHSRLTRKELLEEYNTLGEFHNIPIYDSVIPKEIEELPEDFTDIIFTATSTFKNFIKMYGKESLSGKKIFSIGPITTDSIHECGFDVYKESEYSTIDSIIDCVEEDLKNENEKNKK